MSARNNSKKFSTDVKPFCKVCFDANKPESQYTSHFVRKTKDLNSEILCPIILATECRYCHKLGHTISNCSLRAKNNARNAHAVQRPAPAHVQVPMQVQAPVRGNNRYAAFDVDEEIEVIEEVKVNETEFPSLGGKSSSVQETTKVSYAKAFASKPASSTNCSVVNNKYEEDYEYFSRTQNLTQHQAVVEEEESLTVEEQYGERMYAVLNQYYHSYTGKIVGMLLNCDREELDEFMINARALYERADEAHAILKQAESSAQNVSHRTLAEDNDW
jgi:hypothetical protein